MKNLPNFKQIRAKMVDCVFGHRSVSVHLQEKYSEGGFPGFFEREKNDPASLHYKSFSNCTAEEITGSDGAKICTKLASTGKEVPLDIVCIKPKKGSKNVIVTFSGLFAHYESYDFYQTFPMMAKRAKSKIYTCNYPGIHRSTTNDPNDRVAEFNDLVNSGITLVNTIIKRGTNPNKIVLHGNCLGSAVAIAVQNEFAKKGIKLRIIADNTFSSLSNIAASLALQQVSRIQDQYQKYKSVFEFIMNHVLTSTMIEYCLFATDWQIDNTKTFKFVDPYHFCMQRKGDLSFKSGVLKTAIDKFKDSKTDTCPAEFKESRDRLCARSLLTVKEKEIRMAVIDQFAGKKIIEFFKDLQMDEKDIYRATKAVIWNRVNTSNWTNVFNQEPFTYYDQKYKNVKHQGEIKKDLEKIFATYDTSEYREKLDTHPLGMSQMKGHQTLIANYIKESDHYLASHPQQQPTEDQLPKLLESQKKSRTFTDKIKIIIFYVFVIPIIVITALSIFVINHSYENIKTLCQKISDLITQLQDKIKTMQQSESTVTKQLILLQSLPVSISKISKTKNDGIDINGHVQKNLSLRVTGG